MQEFSLEQSFSSLVAEGASIDVEAEWGAGFLPGRYVPGRPTFSFPEIIRPYLDGATTLLDMGTGDGSALLELRPLPAKTVAYESWPPTAASAVETLKPADIAVVLCDSAPDNADGSSDGRRGLPFRDETFDVALNRHESFDPADVRRMLRPGGWFVTQQVGSADGSALRALLGFSSDEPVWNLETALGQLDGTGLVVEASGEDVGQATFTDIAALIAYIRSTPWEVPDFDLDRLGPRLRELHDQCAENGGIRSVEERFWIVARAG